MSDYDECLSRARNAITSESREGHASVAQAAALREGLAEIAAAVRSLAPKEQLSEGAMVVVRRGMQDRAGTVVNDGGRLIVVLPPPDIDGL